MSNETKCFEEIMKWLRNHIMVLLRPKGSLQRMLWYRWVIHGTHSDSTAAVAIQRTPKGSIGNLFYKSAFLRSATDSARGKRPGKGLTRDIIHRGII
jgi:hypothetical protein